MSAGEGVGVLRVIDRAHDALECGALRHTLGEAHAAAKELRDAVAKRAAMPDFATLDWRLDGGGEPGSTWWPRRRKELEEAGYSFELETDNGQEFYILPGVGDEVVAALARFDGGAR